MSRNRKHSSNLRCQGRTILTYALVIILTFVLLLLENGLHWPVPDTTAKQAQSSSLRCRKNCTSSTSFTLLPESAMPEDSTRSSNLSAGMEAQLLQVVVTTPSSTSSAGTMTGSTPTQPTATTVSGTSSTSGSSSSVSGQTGTVSSSSGSSLSTDTMATGATSSSGSSPSTSDKTDTAVTGTMSSLGSSSSTSDKTDTAVTGTMSSMGSSSSMSDKTDTAVTSTMSSMGSSSSMSDKTDTTVTGTMSSSGSSPSTSYKTDTTVTWSASPSGSSSSVGTTDNSSFVYVNYSVIETVTAPSSSTDGYDIFSLIVNDTGTWSSSTGTAGYTNASPPDTHSAESTSVSSATSATAAFGSVTHTAGTLPTMYNESSTVTLLPATLPPTRPARFPGGKPYPADFEVCNTPFCIAEGAALYRSLSFPHDPCDNFYIYACSKLVVAATPGAQREDADSLLELEIEEKVRNVLNGTATQIPLPVLLLWKGCVAQNTPPTPANLEQIFKKLGFDPFLKLITADVVLNTVADVMTKLSIAPLVSFEINRDPADNSRWIIALDEPDILVTPEQVNMQNQPKTKTHLVQKGCVFIKMLYGQPVQTICDHIADTAIQIAQAHTGDQHPAVRAKGYQVVPYSHVGLLHPLISKMVDPYLFPLTGNARVLLKSPKYLKTTLPDMLTTSPISLYIYVGLHMMVAMAAFVGADDLLDLSLMVSTGKTWNSFPKWRVCLHLVNKLLPILTAMTYEVPFRNATHFDKLMGDIMAEDVRSVFLEHLPSAWFLDAWSRNAIQMKLKHTQIYAFFPLHISSAANIALYMNQIVSSVPKNPDALLYFLSMSQYVVSTGRDPNSFRNFQRRWKGSVFDTICRYVLSENVIMIPVGMFNTTIPTSAKEKIFHIPRIAPRIAQCLFKAVFESAAFYNPNEVLWTDYSREGFKLKLRCFGRQYKYEAYEISEIYSSIEDNAAVKVAFQVFMDNVFTVKYFNKDYQLTGLLGVTSRQLFFIYYAQSYCKTPPADAMARKRMEDRVNIPLKNSRDFSESFDCPLGSGMNPLEKCHAWDI
ncbi:endothelin-converting enzyme 1-like isoform X2 [Ornithodoros turicata]|uniref:endothelin-converting enzyme 1-like isoform X2 n=1 Tax=Ornithodoros turicata TaxID=34597 RepID=UPI0031392749